MSDDYPEDEPIADADRDRPASNDPNGYDRASVEAKSKRCPKCRGNGLSVIFDFDYTGNPIIPGIDDAGDPHPRVGRTVAYCTCLYGRWILTKHQRDAKDCYARIPDLADISGRSSFWLDRDPTYRELEAEEITALPANYRDMMIRRINARAEAHR